MSSVLSGLNSNRGTEVAQVQSNLNATDGLNGIMNNAQQK